MKKEIATMLSFFLLSEPMLNAAWAGTFAIVRAPGGNCSSYQGEAAAPKIGNILGPNLVLSISDTAIQLQKIDEKTGARSTLLTGVLFNAQVRSSEQDPRFNAYCFFNGGEKLPELLGADATASDLLVMIDESRIVGRIVNADANHVTMLVNGAERIVDSQKIETIASSRIFRLSGLIFLPQREHVEHLTNFQARIFRFEIDPTLDEFMTYSGKKRLEAHLTATATGYTKNQKRVMITVATLATLGAIAIPVALAIPLAGRHRVTAAEANRPVEQNDAQR